MAAVNALLSKGLNQLDRFMITEILHLCPNSFVMIFTDLQTRYKYRFPIIVS